MEEKNNKSEIAKELIDAVKTQFKIESKKIQEIKSEVYRERDFQAAKFYAYNGPNFYLDNHALVFNIYIAPKGNLVDFYKKEVIKYFPILEDVDTPYVIDLFAETLVQVLKMDIDLYINKYSISGDGDEYVVAVEYLDEKVSKNAVYLVSDWFYALTENKQFNMAEEFLRLQDSFDKTVFGGPTIYSLVEAGFKRDIPVFFLFEENQFQWGYGKKQLRGRSTTFHTDGIKDTEFTMYKDMVGDFLVMCGFPTPTGTNCFDEDEIVEEAEKLGYPVVVKPVAGHKGQGVVTGIETEAGVRKAYNNIITLTEEEGVHFEGAIVQQQIYGTDHRLISVGEKFGAALERVAAFVIGNNTNTIEELIKEENDKEIRLDNARSPLAKIHIDDDLKDFLGLQGLNIESVPEEGERIELRRVANISAGGVSINVTEKIHPDNIKMVEDIAGFFNVKCLGIDVLAEDIGKSWKEGNFGIIEINAGPGVFMHLAPAYGGSVDVPGMIMRSHFYKNEYSRIPIITGNNISQTLAEMIKNKLHEIDKDIYFVSLTDEGVYLNGSSFFKNQDHDQNVKIALRHPKADIALISHNKDDILDFGTLHKGADIIIQHNADEVEEKVMNEMRLEGSHFIKVEKNTITVSQDEEIINEFKIDNSDEPDNKIFLVIESFLSELIYKYD